MDQRLVTFITANFVEITKAKLTSSQKITILFLKDKYVLVLTAISADILSSSVNFLINRWTCLVGSYQRPSLCVEHAGSIR